jgi:uncharacterized membrane protein
MDKVKAIEVLVQVANLAQKGGLLSLKDAVVVFQSIDAVSENKDQMDSEGETQYPVKE